MCGACGTSRAGWTERIAPLTPGSAPRRARALTALLHATTSATARRTRVTTWPGGGLRWQSPKGWEFAPSLLAAARTLTIQFGPLVPPPQSIPAPPREQVLPFAVTAEATAVWCAAAVEAGWAELPCTLRLGARTIELHEGRVHDRPHERPTLTASYETTELAAHWADSLRDFST
ncbi:hypothetical protein ABT337_03655 [Saccharopolyspora hirsuta]|uniref:hypothetical protein n=1 Tax=Saccharopolyspora hirsuta TaxID=1837 RepID=UPI003320BC88